MEPLGIELQYGKSIISPNDPLRKIDVTQLAEMIIHPEPNLQSAINQLRAVLNINPKKYQELKRYLPYVTCGIFTPPYRKTNNFATIGCMMLDIDHLSRHDINPEELKSRLKSDKDILLMFTSPSADGLKLLFALKEKIFDPAKFSIAYKLFIAQFATKHNLNGLIDRVTSDVTRATFLSIDPNTYFNPNAEKVDLQNLINFNSPQNLSTASSTIKKFEDSLPQENKAKPNENVIPSDILQKIKETLNPNIKTKAEKIIYVPEELEPAVEKVKQRMSELGIEVKNVESIHYGKKFVFTLDNRMAQLNLFYGKQGYKVVVTPVRNSDSELAEVAKLIMCEIFM
jgi:hypothetical protein